MIYKEMHKPAFVFNERLMSNALQLKSIGFMVHVIGKNSLENRVIYALNDIICF